jgi:hypothetical protein
VRLGYQQGQKTRAFKDYAPNFLRPCVDGSVAESDEIDPFQKMM